MTSNGKFIYVFDEDARDRLLKAGFTLLSSDAKNGIYVFANDNGLQFSLGGTEHIVTNTMSF